MRFPHFRRSPQNCKSLHEATGSLKLLRFNTLGCVYVSRVLFSFLFKFLITEIKFTVQKIGDCQAFGVQVSVQKTTPPAGQRFAAGLQGRGQGMGDAGPPCLGSAPFCLPTLFRIVCETCSLLLAEIMYHPPELCTCLPQPVGGRLPPVLLQLHSGGGFYGRACGLAEQRQVLRPASVSFGLSAQRGGGSRKVGVGQPTGHL